MREEKTKQTQKDEWENKEKENENRTSDEKMVNRK